ncbi:MAG: PAS domain-containing sensor histidine kinase [Desulfuromonadales bacterium]|nr:MAG: PAS domain-containing sensor histidine kinase [Desulfuromonadales bacterium]
MSKGAVPSKNRTESLVFVGLIVLSVFWLVDTVNDTIIKQWNCNCDIGPLEHLEIGIHLLLSGLQVALIVTMSRLFRERRNLEENLTAAMANAVEEKSKSEAILAAIGDPVTIHDRDFRIIYQNQVLKEFMGDHGGELCYRAYEKKNAVCDGCPVASAFADGMVHKSLKKSYIQGVPFYLESTASPVRDADGAIVSGIEVVRDVTERIRTEQEIRKLNVELQARADELTARNRDLEAFSYSLSHDLNTPLTKISCAVQTLEEICAEGHDDTCRYLVRTICEGSERMEELIDAMLVLAQVSRRELFFQEVDLARLAGEVIAELRQTEPERRVEFVAPQAMVAVGDPVLLRVVLDNLLGNAWKYTGRVPVARIEFGFVDREEGGCVFFVKDNGAGFDMRHAEQLFKPFQRLHDKEAFPGTGVGLATVQRVVERHGGTVTAHGEPERGATFTFTLPRGR